MTVCIGVVDKKNKCCYVGADYGVSFDSHYTATETPKVFHPCDRKDIVIGCSGSIRMANLLMSDDTLFDGLPEEEYKADDKLIIDLIQTFIPKIKAHAESLKKDDEDFDLIVAIKDRLYRVQSDYAIYEAGSDYLTGGMVVIGSACETAYGAMMMANDINPEMGIGLKLRKAIGICAYYNYGITPQCIVDNT